MDKDNTKPTINELLKELDEKSFIRILNVMDLDKYVKKLTAYKFLQLLITAQVNKLDSLAHLSKFVRDEENLHTQIEIDAISTSQLSRKQCMLSPEIFEKIFQHLVAEIQVRMKQTPFIHNYQQLHVIDSSTMTMSLSQYPWATFKKTKAGVRLHMKVVVTKDLIVPDKAVLLPAKHADRTQMDELITIDDGALYLFDRGYIDYKKFDQYTFENVRFITRLKEKAKIEVLTEQAADPENLIYQDAEVYLGSEVNGTKTQNTFRLIRTEDRKGNLVIILTNCFDLSAKEIGDLYRYRWKIETFFKWMKQHMKIKSFYGKSQNAVYNQIWIALITYCLEVLLQLKVGFQGSLLEIKRTLKTFLFKGFDVFKKALFYEPTRTSAGRKKFDWVTEFHIIDQQFDEREVSHLDDLTYDPLFIDYK